jgi:carbamoyltransferase
MNIEENSLYKQLKIDRYNSIEDYYSIALKKIESGKVIGWINSSYELGPRALGNRSILANPMIKGMKDYINKEVKFREDFRPLAPIMLAENMKKYFNETNWSSNYMLLNFTSKPKTKEKYKEILHVDGTSRVQTVTEEFNSEMYKFLKLCSDRLGVSMLFNTSLNVKGKPILNNTEDINNILNNTKLDSIFIIDEKIIISKI